MRAQENKQQEQQQQQQQQNVVGPLLFEEPAHQQQMQSVRARSGFANIQSSVDLTSGEYQDHSDGTFNYAYAYAAGLTDPSTQEPRNKRRKMSAIMSSFNFSYDPQNFAFQFNYMEPEEGNNPVTDTPAPLPIDQCETANSSDRNNNSKQRSTSQFHGSAAVFNRIMNSGNDLYQNQYSSDERL